MGENIKEISIDKMCIQTLQGLGRLVAEFWEKYETLFSFDNKFGKQSANLQRLLTASVTSRTRSYVLDESAWLLA